MKLLMYLIYGIDIAYYHEAKYSILSCLNYLTDNDDIKIIVVTDQPEYFSNYPVLIETFDKAQYNKWIGEAQYNHRAKNRAMAMILEKYNVPLVFIDTDTYFIDHPIKIFNRISIKNTTLFNYEALISKRPKIHKKLHNTSFIDFHNKKYNFPEDATMWNSGVIGLLPEHKVFLDEALVLLDNFYYLSNGIFTVEQLAISEILRNKTNVHATDDIVIHYFGKAKKFYNKQLSYFFSTLSEKDLIDNPKRMNELKLSIPKPPAYYRLWIKFKVNFSGIRNKDLKKALLELHYAQFEYKHEIESITKNIWFEKVIKNLYKLYDILPKETCLLQDKITKIMNLNSLWVETHPFDPQLIQQWKELNNKFRNL